MGDSQLSVIVPVYNGEKYLTRFFEQVSQILKFNWEIIFVNDGSTDSSMDLLEEFKINHQNCRIVVLNKENAGVSSARNVGLKMASGKFVTFLDCDDEISKNYGEVINQNLNKEVDLVCFDYDVISPNKIKKKFLSTTDDIIFVNTKDVFDQYINGYWITRISNSVCNKVYKKNIIDQSNIQFNLEKRIGEDLLFNLEYLLNCGRIQILHESLYYYYMNEGSAMKHYDPQNAEEIFKYYDILNHISHKFNYIIPPFKMKMFFLYRLYPVIAHECQTSFSVGLRKIKKYVDHPIFKEKVPFSYLTKLNFVQLVSLIVYSFHLIPLAYFCTYCREKLFNK